MDLLQAHPEVKVVFAANDYMIMGVAQAAKSLGRRDIVLLGNDGDTAALEAILAGRRHRHRQHHPVRDGPDRAAGHHATRSSDKFKGGFVETPTTIVDKGNVLPVLKAPDTLYPKPSKAY